MKNDAKLSVIIITKNEQDNIERCLKSIPSGSEIIVIDSNSEDLTARIATDWGCKVFQRPFINYADQKNFALAQATRPWVLAIDADEELLGYDDNLISRLEAYGVSGLYVTRKLVFMKKIMRFGKTSDAPLRFFKRESSFYEGAIHEKVKVSGKLTHMTYLTLLHYSYRDLSDYFTRFNRYTSAVAENHSKKNRKISMVSHLFRPWFEFISRYFLRLGFLDGYPGYTYALTSSLYAYIKYAKLIEKRRL